MKMNEKAFLNAFEKIKAESCTLSLAWLLVRDDKTAVLIDSDKDVMLFDLNGRLCFSHHCTEPSDGSYSEAIDFFENSFSGSAEDIVTMDSQLTDKLITDNISELTSLHQDITAIRYICSIFKLNKLFGIHTEDIPDSFYLRFGAVNEKGRTVLYHDIEYLTDDNGEYKCIDDFVFDADTQ